MNAVSLLVSVTNDIIPYTFWTKERRDTCAPDYNGGNEGYRVFGESIENPVKRYFFPDHLTIKAHEFSGFRLTVN